MGDPLPKITHLQCLVLEMLGPRPRVGRELRDLLANSGVHVTRPAFYQLMLRLEDSGHASGAYCTKVVDGQTIKERQYCITAAGIRAFNEALDFYSRPRIAVGLAYA